MTDDRRQHPRLPRPGVFVLEVSAGRGTESPRGSLWSQASTTSTPDPPASVRPSVWTPDLLPQPTLPAVPVTCAPAARRPPRRRPPGDDPAVCAAGLERQSLELPGGTAIAGTFARLRFMYQPHRLTARAGDRYRSLVGCPRSYRSDLVARRLPCR